MGRSGWWRIGGKGVIFSGKMEERWVGVRKR